MILADIIFDGAFLGSGLASSYFVDFRVVVVFHPAVKKGTLVLVYAATVAVFFELQSFIPNHTFFGFEVENKR